MNFQWAIEQLKAGKEVRRKSWEGKSTKGFKPDYRHEWKYSIEQIEATDWEIYCKEHDWELKQSGDVRIRNQRRCKNCGRIEIVFEKETLSDKEQTLGSITKSYFEKKDAKEKIQNAHKRLKEEKDTVDKIFKEEFGDKSVEVKK